MAEAELKIECDFVDDTDGGIKMKMRELHIHLPPPPEGRAYSIEVIQQLAFVTTKQIGDDK